MISVVGIGLLALLSPAARAEDYAHAIVIVVDDLGVDKVGAYAGDVTNPTETRPSTPTLDLLADAGVRFSDAWASPSCSPARATLYSGEYAYRNKVGSVISFGSNARLGTTPLNLQQLASDAGLSTALFGKWHLGTLSRSPSEPSEAFDFQEYVNRTGFGVYRGALLLESYTDWLYVESEPDAAMSSGYVTRATQIVGTSPTDQANADAVEFMTEQVAAARRHLTVVSYNLPHVTEAESGGTSYDDAVLSCGGTPGRDQVENHRFVVECMDGAIAALLDGVPDLERTVVVFFGDNGTMGNVAQGSFADGRGKGTVYESGVRVPFIFADGQALRDLLDNGGTLPSSGTYGIDVGGVVSAPSSIVDVYATLADLLALDPGTCHPGRDCAEDSLSLRSALTGGPALRESAWTERYVADTTAAYGAGAVRVGDMKLLVNTDESDPACRAYEMYDLASDRWEQQDLWQDPAYVAERAELLAALAVHVDAMAGGRGDWLGHPDCCVDVETWYDGIDANCDGSSDYDADQDGADAADYGGTDCDDADAAVFPGAEEVWYDGVDADCDGASDYDADQDGVDAVEHGGADCDDTNVDAYPGAPDAWYDGVDGDCGGGSDFDADGDGVDALDFGGTDCDDADAARYPGAADVSGDGLDQDCDGADAAEDTGCGGCASGAGGPTAAAWFPLLALAALRRRRGA
jgi:arylsulfatase A-like enzyme